MTPSSGRITPELAWKERSRGKEPQAEIPVTKIKSKREECVQDLQHLMEANMENIYSEKDISDYLAVGCFQSVVFKRNVY